MERFIKPNLVDVGRNEEATPGTFGAAIPQAINPHQLRNYAEDEATVGRITNEIIPLMVETRAMRMPMHDEWNAIRRMVMMRHDDGQRYRGRSNAYVPVYSRMSNTIVASLSRGLFPSDEYMDVIDRGSGDPEASRPVKQYIQWEYERNAKLRQYIKPFLRQYVDYGNSPLKVFYKKELRKMGRTVKVPDLLSMSGQRSAPSFTTMASYDGLCVSPRSVFNWYVYPQTAESLADATLVFEDVRVPRAYIEAMGRKGLWSNVEAAVNAPPVPNEDSETAQLAEDTAGMSSTVNAAQSPHEMLTLTEVWCYLRLPKSAYFEDEDSESPIPARILLAGDTVVRCTRNPFWHQQPPYLIARKNVHPGFFYGRGYGHMVRSLQYLSNDFANMTADNAQYTLNPIVKTNPTMLLGKLPPLAPGVNWPMLSPDAVTFDRPPIELINGGMQSLNLYLGLTQDFGGAPPIIQGQGAGGGAKTATGAQILQRNAMTPLQDEVEDIENDVMVPLCHMTWVLAQQYREESVMVTVGGSQPMKVDPEQLAIDAEFIWCASSQAANQQQRAQQGMAFIQALLPLVPLFQAQGKMVNFEPLLKKVYSSGFGWRGFDQIIQPMPMMPGMPGMGPPGMGPPGAEGPADPGIRSTLEQVGGPPGEMVAGEGEDFAQVRNEADDLAAMMGGMPFGGGEF